MGAKFKSFSAHVPKIIYPVDGEMNMNMWNNEIIYDIIIYL